LPREIDVCPVHLPGRGRRFREPSHTRLEPLVGELYEEVRRSLDLPIVLFELACRLTDAGTPPVSLFASACAAPQLPRQHTTRHLLPDDQFIACVREMNGIPPQLLRQPGLLDVIVPILRADFAVAETYHYAEGPRLPCPVSVLGGVQDVHVAREELLAWRDRTQRGFRLRILPGGHFFLHDDEAAAIRAVTDDLAGILRTCRAPVAADSR
jgi:medium-chain acyl-[acyl-carrier-protein] hydrolase